MDNIDGIILNEIQDGIPIEKRPFKIIADRIGLEEDEVIERINNLKKDGFIRRFGGLFDSGKLGIVSTLVGAKIKGDIKIATYIINEYKGVTHNYERDNEYNIWFTLMAGSVEEIDRILEEIKVRTGAEDMLILPSTKKHKVKVYLDFNKK